MPSLQEREALLSGLKTVIARCGPERFVNGSILRCEDLFSARQERIEFRDVLGAARRLTISAGLDDLEPVLSIDRIELGLVDDHALRKAAMAEGSLRITLPASLMDLRDDLAGFLAREVSAAFMLRHEIAAGDARVDLLLAAAAEVYLGFGILAANSLHAYRGRIYDFHGHYDPGHISFATIPIEAPRASQASYAFLLAVMTLACDFDEESLAWVRRQLLPDQKAAFDAARAEQGEAPEALRSWFGVSLPEDADPPEEPMDETLPPEAEAAVEVLEIKGWNEGAPVFRVSIAPKLVALSLGGSMGVSIGALFIPFGAPELFGLLGAAAGYFLSRLFRKDICSSPACRKPLKDEDLSCSHCGGLIRGRIKRMRQHHKMVERLRPRSNLTGELFADEEAALARPSSEAFEPDWAALGIDPTRLHGLEKLSFRKDGLVIRVKGAAGHDSVIIKCLEEGVESTEMQAYALLRAWKVPTLPLHGRAGNALMIEDLASSARWRLAETSDQESVEFGRAVGDWYLRLHEAGRGMLNRPQGAPAFLERWVDRLDPYRLETAGEKLGFGYRGVWRYAIESLESLQRAFNALPQTINYDDFALENVACSRQGPRRVLVFDYGQICLGPAVTDQMNVLYGLSGPAREGFLERYGPAPEYDRALLEPLAQLNGLMVASERRRVPSWALPLIEGVRSGRFGEGLNAALDLL